MKKIIQKIETIEKELDLYVEDQYYSLYIHECGLLIFYAKLYKYFKQKKYLLKVESLINKVIDGLNNTEKLKNNFAYGLVGILWTFEYLKQNNFIDSTINDIHVKTYVNDLSLSYVRNKNFDLMYGLIGNGVLSLENNFYPCESIIDYFYQNSIISKHGIKWFNNIEHSKQGSHLYNLGLAHGIPSVISFCSLFLLNKKSNSDEAIKKAIEVIKKGIEYLLSLKQSDSISFFSTCEDIKNSKTRLAWCYGDLGISIALWQAGEALQDESIKQEAIDICLHTTKRRTPEETGVVDAGICHGTAGIAHIYNRMYRYTKREEFKDAANYWIEETLKMATFEDGLAGYKAWQGKELGWKNEYGLLEGIAGIGLVLLSHISEEEPTWDRCLLLS